MTINKLLVCLDLSKYDESCIQKAHYISSTAKNIQSITFLHNIRYDFLSNIKSFTQEDMADLKYRIEQDINQKIISYKFDEIAEVSVKVTENDETVHSLITESADQNTLVIMGLKDQSDGKGILPTRFLEKDQNNSKLFLCSKKTSDKLTRVTIATNKKSIDEYKHLISWMNNFDSSLVFLTVDKVPLSYFPYIKSDKSIEIKKRPTLNTTNSTSRINSITIEGHDISESIQEYANKNKVDLIILNRAEKSKKLITLPKVGSTIIRMLQSNSRTNMLIL